MGKFSDALNSGSFVVTSELNPPKGTELGPLIEDAELLDGVVDAFNLTDSASSRMGMAPAAVGHLLLDRGIEPILQVTGRDRNRIALQSDLLGANALGITNILCMTGDPPGSGDHPDAKGVFDLDGISLLQAISSMRSGQDMGGNDLKGAPRFLAGAVVNPGAPDLDAELRRMEQKIDAGARFFQTQAVYDPSNFESFMAAISGFDVPVLAGMIILKSAGMARRLNENLPGVHVPDHIINKLDRAKHTEDAGVKITARIIDEIRSMCSGVHIMALGWETRIPEVIEMSGVRTG